MSDNDYRGFRADRIDFLIDAETGETVAHNILDWLAGRAQRQSCERRRVQRPQAETSALVC